VKFVIRFVTRILLLWVRVIRALCHQSPTSLIALAQYVQYFLKQKDYEAHCHVPKIFTWYYYRSVTLFTTTQVNGTSCHQVVLLGNQLAVLWLRDQWTSHVRNNIRRGETYFSSMRVPLIFAAQIFRNGQKPYKLSAISDV